MSGPSAPERLHIVWNAADAIDHGLVARIGETVTPEQISAVLARQRGKLFRLIGWAVGVDATEVALSILDASSEGIHVVNHNEPPFEGVYEVAAEPPPFMSQHGDCVFDMTAHPDA
jgi:hypothetical protein